MIKSPVAVLFDTNGDPVDVALEDTQLGKVTKTTAFFYTVGGDIDRIETTIGLDKIVDQFTYTVGGDIESIARTVVPA